MMRSKTIRVIRARGSALVELSLVCVLFLVLLLGILDFGQFLFFQQALVERAQQSARWGAVTDPTNSAAIKNMILYAQATAPPDGTQPAFGLTSGMITVSTPDTGTDNYRLVVQVSGYSYQAFSPYLASRYTGVPITIAVPLGLYR